MTHGQSEVKVICPLCGQITLCIDEEDLLYHLKSEHFILTDVEDGATMWDRLKTLGIDKEDIKIDKNGK